MDVRNYDTISLPRDKTSEVADRGSLDRLSHVEFLKGLLEDNSGIISSKKIERLVSIVLSKNTNKDVLLLVIDILESFYRNYTILDKESQSKISRLPAKIANHENSNCRIVEKSSELMSFIAQMLPKLSSEEAKQSFFQNIATFGRLGQGFSWKIGLYSNIVDAVEAEIDSLKEIGGKSLVSYVEGLNQQCGLMTEQEVQTLQKTSILLMSKLKFQNESDKEEFKRMLSIIPENLRTEEYTAALKDLEKSKLDHDLAEEIE